VIVPAGRDVTLSKESLHLGTGTLKLGPYIVRAEPITQLEKIEVLDTSAKAEPFANTSNIDLPRTVDDVQPYYMWNSSQIENSGAMDLQDFFQRMVPMDTNRESLSQVPTGAGNLSNISLGGLSGNSQTTSGTQNTLILVDGLPLPNINYLSSTYEPDLNGIPLAAIDHVEVLPASASAIYGASAAGGVVNVVLKHDYTGVELSYSFNNTFSGSAPENTVSLTAGVSLEGGKTNLLVTASYDSVQALTTAQRSQIWGPYEARFFAAYPGGELAYAGVTNAAGAFTSSSAGYLSTPIITSANGTPLFAGSTATTVQVPAGYTGGSGLAPLQANIGNFNLAHPNNANQVGIHGLDFPLTQSPIEKAISVLLRRNMTPWLEVYADLLTSSNSFTSPVDYFSFGSVTVAANAPGNPFGQAVKVSGTEQSNLLPYSTDTVSQDLSFGAKLSLPHDWKAEINYTWGQSELGPHLSALTDTTALGPAMNSGAINLIADLSRYPINASAYSEYVYYPGNSSVNDVQAKAAGPLFRLWSGSPTLAVGIEHRKAGNGSTPEYISEPANGTVPGVTTGSLLWEEIYYPGASVSDDSAYAELNVPLVSKANRVWGVTQLDLQAAGRYDSLEEFTTSPTDTVIENELNSGTVTSPDFTGTTTPEPFTPNTTRYHSTNGTFGFKYKPVDDVFFRWSYSTSLVPPTYSQLLAPISGGTQVQPTGAYPGVPTTSPWAYRSIADPLLNATYDVPVEAGGNPHLQPETSHGIDWGVVFEPTFLKGLRVSVDYTKVTKYNDIITPSVASLLAYSAEFPGRVTRGTPNAGQSIGPVVLINDTYINAPETFTASYNIEVDYSFKLASLGGFKLSGVATSWQHYSIQSVIGGAFVEQLGNPDAIPVSGGLGQGAALAKFKGNLGLDWNKGPFSAGWLVRYVGPYTDGSYYGSANGVPSPDFYGTLSNNGWVSGQIYHDVYVGYKLGKAVGGAAWWKRALANSKIQVGVINLFNHIPPYDGSPLGSDGVPLLMSAYGDLRLAEYRVSIKKSW